MRGFRCAEQVAMASISRERHLGLFNIQFLHGFIVLHGMTDAGVPVDANYGFGLPDILYQRD
jgi:hypothetical protein